VKLEDIIREIHNHFNIRQKMDEARRKFEEDFGMKPDIISLEAGHAIAQKAFWASDLYTTLDPEMSIILREIESFITEAAGYLWKIILRTSVPCPEWDKGASTWTRYRNEDAFVYTVSSYSEIIFTYVSGQDC